MRIGIDARTLSYEYTGIPTFVHDIIMHWNELDTEDEFFLYSNRPFTLDFELKQNWHIVIDEYKRGGIWVQTRIPSLLKRDSIEVYWEPMNFLPRKVEGIRYVVVVNDISVYKNPKYGTFSEAVLQRMLFKKSCERADEIVAISEATKSDIVRVLGVSPEKIKVVYIGDSPYRNKEKTYSDDERHSILGKWNISSSDYLLYVGTLEPRKNIPTIVGAFNELKKTGKFTGRLVLAGKKGWKSEKIFDSIENSPYTKDIVITGYVSPLEKECLYREASCLVFPSYEEGFGLPIVEAMSVGLPVVTTYGSSMPEVGGDAARYIQTEDLDNANAVADQIELILKMDVSEKDIYSKKAIDQSLKFNRLVTSKEMLDIVKTPKGDKSLK